MAKAQRTPIPPFPPDIDRDFFGAWLSGLTDGEGHFGLSVEWTRGRESPHCCFGIGLRDDDFPALARIRSFFGCGGLYHSTRCNKTEHAQASCKVFSATDLAQVIVPHFDRFPLQAKKANDFRIWRKAVLLCFDVRRRRRRGLGRTPSGGYPGFRRKWTSAEVAEFVALKDALRAQRKYNAAAVELPAPRPSAPEPPGLFDWQP